MGDTTFRTKQIVEEAVEKPTIPVVETQMEVEDHIEVPYLDAKNFLEDYFQLGTQWKDADEVFAEDLFKLDIYFADLIDQGYIANSQSAVKNELKKMEKLNNLIKEERSVVKLEVLGNYAEFLTKNNNLKSKLRRYAN